MIDTAKSAGFSYSPAIWLAPTFAALPFAYWSYTGYQYVSFFSGEVKSIKSAMIAANFGMIIYDAIFYAFFAYFFVAAVGEGWLNNAAFVAFGTSKYALPVSFSPYFLATLLTDSVPLAFLINFSLFAWGLMQYPPLVLAYTRILFGASFDRVLPTRLADVNDRYHAPIKATIVAAILLWVGLILGLYAGVIFASFNTTLGYCIVFTVGSVTAMAFPYWKKDIFNASPISRLKIGKVPLVTILGAASFVFFIYLAIDIGLNPVLAPTNPLSFAILALTFLGTGAIYYISRAYHKAKDGFDIRMTFMELPPE
jgi:amino acid transporter